MKKTFLSVMLLGIISYANAQIVTGPTASSCTNSIMGATLYSAGNPIAGGNSGSYPAFTSFDKSSQGESGPGSVVSASQIGSCWGVAYNRANSKFYVSAFLKRFAGFGPGGPGAIYEINGSSATLFANVASMGVNVGTDPRTPTSGTVDGDNELGANVADVAWDVNAFGLVGKMSLGGLDISDDGTKMYTVSLASKELVELNISSGSAVFSNKYAVPSSCGYPFAVKCLLGKVYVGVTCEDASEASIYEFNAGSFSLITSFSLSYNRGRVGGAGGFADNPAEWNAWTDVFRTVNEEAPINRTDNVEIFPQPILSDIEFDTDGSIIVALMDRNGHQTGMSNHKPISGDQSSYTGTSAGDVLRIGVNGSSYQIENNGSAGGVTTTGTSCFGDAKNGVGNAQGPGNGEFYWSDSYIYNPCNAFTTNTHDELSFGGLAYQPGSGEVAVSAMNPTATANSGGVIWMSNTTGERTHMSNQFDNTMSGYRLFYSPSIGDGGFGKANGMGDIELACEIMTPLPVNLKSFTATVANKCVAILSWEIESENNLSYFEIEKSIDGVNFEKIATVEYNNKHSLQTIISNLTSGNNYFRLKMIDADKKYLYSQIVSTQVNCVIKNSIKVYPNPANSILNIEINEPNKETYFVQLQDMLGRIVYSNEMSIIEATQLISVNTNSIVNGQYILTISSTTSSKRMKITIAK